MADRTVRVVFEAVTSGYQARVASASMATKRFGSETAMAAKRHSEAFTTAGIVVGAAGAAIAGGLGVSAKAAMDFESSFAGVRKTVEATEPEFAKLSDELRKMAPELGTNVNELNAIAESAGQLGIETENVSSFTRTIAILGETTNLAGQEGATMLARFAAVTQMPQDQFSNLAATLVELGNNFETTEAEIAEFSLRMAGAGTIAGLTEADILGIGAAMSSVGVPAERGGTAVQKVLLGITDSVNTADERLSIFARTAGMSASEFQIAWKEDAGQAFVAFVEGLGREGQNAQTVLRELGLTDQRLIASFLALANAGDKVRESVEMAGGAFQENNAHTKEFEKRMETARKKVDQAKAQLNDLAITIGAIILPALGTLAEIGAKAFGSIAEFINALPEPLQGVAVGFAALLAAMLLVSGAALVMLPRLMAIKVALGEISATSSLAATGVAGFGTALRLAGFAGMILLATQLADKFNDLADAAFGANDEQSNWGTILEEGLRSGLKAVPGLGVLADSMLDVDKSTEEAKESLADLLAENEGYQGAIAGSADASKKAAGVLDGWAGAAVHAGDEVKSLGQATKKFTDVTKTEMRDWREGTVLSLGTVSNRFEKLRDKGKLTAGDIAQAFEDMLSAQRDFRKNWRQVSNVWGKDTDDIAKFISERMGVDVPTAMKILADADKRTLKSIKEDYRDWRSEANKTASSLSGDFDKIGGKVRGVRDDVASLGTQLHKLPSGVKIDVKATGTQIGDGPGAMGMMGGLAASWARQAITAVPGPQGISNTYRSPAHNAAVGGAPGSYHTDASNPAADITGTNLMGIFNWLVTNVGRSAREIIFTPAGYSIQHGARAPNIGDHYDHVHVADEGGWFRGPGTLAMGRGMEYFASGLQPAQKVKDIVPTSPVRQVIREDSGRSGGTLRIRGTLNTPFGPAEVRGIAEEVVEGAANYSNSRARVNR